MDEEMDSFHQNSIWELEKFSKRENILDANGHLLRKMIFFSQGVKYKSRLVANAYTRYEGIDYNKIFFLVVRHPFIHILLVLIVQLDS